MSSQVGVLKTEIKLISNVPTIIMYIDLSTIDDIYDIN